MQRKSVPLVIADGSHVGNPGGDGIDQLQEWIPFHHEPCGIADVAYMKYQIHVASFSQCVINSNCSRLHISSDAKILLLMRV